MKSALTKIWRRQLDLQLLLTARNDLAFLPRLPGWKRAKRVLDLGCGNGRYTKTVAARFKTKRFVAVDRDSSLLGRNFRNIQFLAHDLCAPIEWAEPFDFAIARLVVQHLSSPAKFLQNARTAIKAGGYLQILDADDSHLRWSHRLPTVEVALSELSRRQASLGTGRGWRCQIERMARPCGFEIILSRRHRYSSRIDKRAFRDMFLNLGKLMAAHFKISFDEKDYRDELNRWHRQRGSHAHFGQQTLLLRRIK